MRLWEPMSFRSFATSALALAAVVALSPAAPARPHPSPTPTATPTPPPEDPAVTIVARREFVAWQAGVVDKARYAAQTQAQLTDDKVLATSKALSVSGALVQTKWLGFATYENPPPPGVKSYVYEMLCSEANIYVRLTIGPDGKIDGIFFSDKPPQ